MVGRADDPSAIAYNAAGITQLPGTHVMGGFAAIAPMGTIDLDLADGSHTSTTTKPHIWAAPHAYITHQLNDRFWLGLAYRPLENLSFEVGTVFTRWSTYDSMNIYFDSDFQSINHKKWRDGWNFNASVEYEPLDWLALRAGIWYETPVTNEAHADFMVPSHGRTGVSVGAGFQWGNWTLDLAYAHLWVHSLDYSETDASG